MRKAIGFFVAAFIVYMIAVNGEAVGEVLGWVIDTILAFFEGLGKVFEGVGK